MADIQVQTGTDENGNPIYNTVTVPDAPDSATTPADIALTTAVGTALSDNSTALQDAANADSAAAAAAAQASTAIAAAAIDDPTAAAQSAQAIADQNAANAAIAQSLISQAIADASALYASQLAASDTGNVTIDGANIALNTAVSQAEMAGTAIPKNTGAGGGDTTVTDNAPTTVEGTTVNVYNQFGQVVGTAIQGTPITSYNQFGQPETTYQLTNVTPVGGGGNTPTDNTASTVEGQETAPLIDGTTVTNAAAGNGVVTGSDPVTGEPIYGSVTKPTASSTSSTGTSTVVIGGYTPQGTPIYTTLAPVTSPGGGNSTPTDNTASTVTTVVPDLTVSVVNAARGVAATATQSAVFYVGETVNYTTQGPLNHPLYLTQTLNYITGPSQLMNPTGLFTSNAILWTTADIGDYTQVWTCGSQSVTVRFTVAAAIITPPAVVAPPSLVAQDQTLNVNQYGFVDFNFQFTGGANEPHILDTVIGPRSGALTNTAWGMYVPKQTLGVDLVGGFQYRYTPASGFVGSDTINFTVRGSGSQQLSNQATVSITVIPAPAPPPKNPPIAGNRMVVLDQNNYTDFDFPYTGTADVVTEITGPTNGTLVQLSGFRYRYTPKHDYAGSDVISFRVHSDAQGTSQNLGVISITVDPLPVVVRPDPISFTSYSNQPSAADVTGSTVTLGTGFSDAYTALLECTADSAGNGAASQLTSSYVRGWTRSRPITTYTYAPGIQMNSYSSYWADSSGTPTSNADDVTWFDNPAHVPSSQSVVSDIYIPQSYTTSVFNYNDFISTNGLSLSGAAAAVNDGYRNVLRLVPLAANQLGSSFTTAQYNITKFHTYFQFRITGVPQYPTADGFVFSIQPSVPVLGGLGGGLGYSGSPSVGIKFDVYQNVNVDPSGNYIALVRDGNVSNNPQGYQVVSAGYMGNGDVWSCWVDYDGTTLEIRLADNSSTRPASPTWSVAVDIPGAIGQTKANLGFSSSTGYGRASHDILSWTYGVDPAAPTVLGPASRLYTGFFQAPSTETYTFSLISDDATYVWLGDTALVGYRKDNALLAAGGVHTADIIRTATVDLQAGTYYPIRVAYGNFQDDCALILQYSTPSISKTSIPAGQLWYSTGSAVSHLTETLGNNITILNGDAITPLVRSATAVAGDSRTLTFRTTVTGSNVHAGYNYNTNFTVSTVPADLVPDAFVLVGAGGLEINDHYVTNTVTLSGISPGLLVPVRVTPDAQLIINGVLTGNSSTVTSGTTLAVRVPTASTYNTINTFTVTVAAEGQSPISSTFSVATRSPHVTLPPWGFGNRNGLELSTAYNTPNTVTFVGLELAGHLGVSGSATVVLNGVDLGVSSTIVNNGDSVAFRATTANAFSTASVYTVTLNVLTQTYTDTFTFTTRSERACPQFNGNYTNIQHQELGVTVTSEAVSLSNFDLTRTLHLTSTDSTAQLVINGTPSGTTATVNSGDTVAITGTSADDYYTTTQYVIENGCLSTVGWTVTTKVNDDLQLMASF
jgi:Legume lectin domain/GLEYA domain/Bacterial Ig domain